MLTEVTSSKGQIGTASMLVPSPRASESLAECAANMP